MAKARLAIEHIGVGKPLGAAQLAGGGAWLLLSVGIAPACELLVLHRDLDGRCADGDADRVVGKLVGIDAVAL
jgi:hypothetical protein